MLKYLLLLLGVAAGISVGIAQEWRAITVNANGAEWSIRTGSVRSAPMGSKTMISGIFRRSLGDFAATFKIAVDQAHCGAARGDILVTTLEGAVIEQSVYSTMAPTAGTYIAAELCRTPAGVSR